MSSPEPKLSAICPSDLGLKAAFWSGKDGEDVKFLPIAGWVSVTNYLQSDKEPFAAVVLSASGRPVIASPSFFPDFVGTFGRDLSSGQVIEILRNAGMMRATATGPKRGGGTGGAGPRPPSTMPGPIE